MVHEFALRINLVLLLPVSMFVGVYFFMRHQLKLSWHSTAAVCLARKNSLDPKVMPKSFDRKEHHHSGSSGLTTLTGHFESTMSYRTRSMSEP